MNLSQQNGELPLRKFDELDAAERFEALAATMFEEITTSLSVEVAQEYIGLPPGADRREVAETIAELFARRREEVALCEPRNSPQEVYAALRVDPMSVHQRIFDVTKLKITGPKYQQ